MRIICNTCRTTHEIDFKIKRCLRCNSPIDKKVRGVKIKDDLLSSILEEPQSSLLANEKEKM